MPEERKFTERIEFRCTPAMKAALEEFARTHEVTGGVAEVLRQFVKLGLATDASRRNPVEHQR